MSAERRMRRGTFENQRVDAFSDLAVVVQTQLPVTTQPTQPTPVGPRRLRECKWKKTTTLTIPRDWLRSPQISSRGAAFSPQRNQELVWRTWRAVARPAWSAA